jgi:hypothetical protein
MLKNDAILPLTVDRKIAVVSGACAAVHDPETLLATWDRGDYYVVGGSGRVIAPRITSVLDALRAGGADVVGTAGDDLDAALEAAQCADVIVACGGAATTEAADRASLRLDNHDFLAALVAAADKPVALVALAPGAVVLPQADAAAAAVVCFLCGEATGWAIADVLLGRREPGGRLPVTIPRTEAATVQPCAMDTCPYTEGVRGGYRGMDASDAHYPFGHGLGYAIFDLDVLEVTGGETVDVTAVLRHVAGPGGSAVVQVYASGRLRAFEKVFLDEGERVVSLRFHSAVSEVSIGFSSLDVATYAVKGDDGLFRRDTTWWILVMFPPFFVFSIIGCLLVRDRKRRQAEEQIRATQRRRSVELTATFRPGDSGDAFFSLPTEDDKPEFV